MLLLTCMSVVRRSGPEASSLPRVLAKLHAFFDVSPRWTLGAACAANLSWLVRRIIDQGKMEPMDSGKRGPAFRQWQFDTAMLQAVAVGSLEIALLLADHFSGCLISEKVVKQMATLGRLESLQWLVGRRRDVRWMWLTAEAAIKESHFETAKWMDERITTTNGTSSSAKYAAAYGNLKMLQWICSLCEETYLVSALSAASHGGHLGQDAIGFSLSNTKIWLDGIEPYRVDGAAASGHIGVMERLLCYHPDKCHV